ncbi:MAG: ABC transporter permease [Caldilineaceae bacterium SB0668_bin_21]|nr:ABC transporter permease [Caldilineaceae bacterium SB0668_bin_21]MYC20225.1 ABC transporter permease [Caldilineaceae bacterium SB0662_bin_25]
MASSQNGASADTTLQSVDLEEEQHESYFQLVWQRFRKSRPAIAGGLMVLSLIILAIFAEFFAPVDPTDANLQDSFIPPTRIRLIDAEGNFHLRPFIYNQVVTIDPKTFEPLWEDDPEQRYDIQFMVKSWEWKILGLFPTRYHLFGVGEGGKIHLLGTEKQGRDLWGRACAAGRISLSLSLFATIVSIVVGAVVGIVSGYYGGVIDNVIQRFVEFVASFPQLPLWLALAAIIPRTWDSLQVFIIMVIIFSLLSWTLLAREVRGKVLAFRETDFILAAKEMGASDARIIFLHLFPNSISHIIVVLTLTIPQIILAEAFLSFLGIGIQEPLVSWGFLMRDAQNLQTLGTHTWIMTPVVFIIVAVLGFNFLGDGLRDAADPYSIV